MLLPVGSPNRVLPPAPKHLLAGRNNTTDPEHSAKAAGSSMVVRRFRLLLVAPAGQPLALNPTPPGIHRAVASWLHARKDDDRGEPHNKPHSYAVCAKLTSTTQLEIEIRLFDERLVPVLTDRAQVGDSENFGRVKTILCQVDELSPIDLSRLQSRQPKQWQLDFPSGVTFTEGRHFIPWPSPYYVLRGIKQRLNQFWNHEPTPHLTRDEVNRVVPTALNLETRRWPERKKSESHRTVSAALGHMEWTCTADSELAARIDLLLQIGSVVSVGAKTAWGLGELRVS